MAEREIVPDEANKEYVACMVALQQVRLKTSQLSRRMKYSVLKPGSRIQDKYGLFAGHCKKLREELEAIDVHGNRNLAMHKKIARNLIRTTEMQLWPKISDK